MSCFLHSFKSYMCVIEYENLIFVLMCVDVISKKKKW